MVDFAAMRDAISRLGGDPETINPVCPADLVIDHSVQADLTRRLVRYYTLLLLLPHHLFIYFIYENHTVYRKSTRNHKNYDKPKKHTDCQ